MTACDKELAFEESFEHTAIEEQILIQTQMESSFKCKDCECYEPVIIAATGRVKQGRGEATFSLAYRPNSDERRRRFSIRVDDGSIYSGIINRVRMDASTRFEAIGRIETKNRDPFRGRAVFYGTDKAKRGRNIDLYSFELDGIIGGGTISIGDIKVTSEPCEVTSIGFEAGLN